MRTKGLKPERVCWRGAVINALLKSTSGPPRSRRLMPSGFQAKWLTRPPLETDLKMLLVPQVT